MANPTDTSEEINVVGPYGVAGTIPRHQLEDAKRIGYREERPEETHERVLQRQYGDRPIAAGLEGVARGLTFGLSDYAIPFLGIDSKEGVRETQERNAVAAGIGEVGSLLVPWGGESLLAGKAGRLAAGLVRAGRTAEEIAAGSKIARIAGRYIPAIARAGAEGATLGARQGISQTALSEDPFTVEALASNIATHALTGAAVGGLAGGLGQAASDVVASGRGALQRVATKEVESTSPGEVSKILESRAAPEAKTLRALTDEAKSLRQEIESARKSTPEVLSTPEYVAKTSRYEELAKIVSPESQAASRAAMDTNTIKLGESRYGKIGDEDLDTIIQGQNIPGLTSAKQLNPGQLDAVKADWYHSNAAQEQQFLDGVGAIKESGGQGVIKSLLASFAKHKLSGLASGIGATVGHMTGIPGASYIGAVVAPQLAESLSAVIDSTAIGQAQKLAGHVDSLLGATAKGAVVVPKLTTSATLAAHRLYDAPEKSKKTPETPALPGKSGSPSKAMREEFLARSNELHTLMANQAATGERFHSALSGIRMVNPLLGDRVESQKKLQLQYLYQQLPKNPGIGSFIGRPRQYLPSDALITQWSRKLEIAENPTAIFKHMANNSLTKDHVDAFKALYPETYLRVQSDIISRMGELQTTLPFEQQCSLSLFFGVPVSSLMRPESVATLQANLEPTEDESAGQIPAPSSGSTQPEPTGAQKLAS